MQLHRTDRHPVTLKKNVSSHFLLAQWMLLRNSYCMWEPADAGAMRFQQSYEAHRSRIEGFLRTLCRDSDLAAELCQETFVRAFRYRESFDARKGSEEAWLFQVARNVFLADFRRSKARSTSTIPENTRDPLALDPSAALGRAEITRAIESLPGPEREVLILRRLEGKTVEQTAAQLNVSPRSVNRRLAAALQILHETLVARDLIDKGEVNYG